MAYYGSRGRGGGAPARAAAPAAPDDARPGARRLAGMPAADLVGHLIRRNRRASDFVDVALVLAARERRLAEAEEAAARLRGEIVARERGDAGAEAQIRRLVAATEARLQAEIRGWQRRAAEAEARLQAFAGGRDGHREVAEQHGFEGAGIGAPSSLKSITGPALAPPVLQAELHGEGTEVGIVGIADLIGHEGEAQAEEEDRRREEAPLQVAFGKRKEPAAATSEGHSLKKLIKLRAGGGTCSNAVSEANTSDESESEAEAEDACDDQYALAIVPDGCDLPEASPEIGDVLPRTPTGPKHGGTDMSVEGNHESENLVALAVVAPGHELLPPDGGVGARGVQEEAGGQKPEVTAGSAYARWRGDGGDDPKNGVLDMEGSPSPAATHSGAIRDVVVPEPGAGEKCSVAAVAANGPPRKKGMIYKMVFKALKEKERQVALAKPATASEAVPSLRCWLYAPLPKESVAEEEGS